MAVTKKKGPAPAPVAPKSEHETLGAVGRAFTSIAHELERRGKPAAAVVALEIAGAAAGAVERALAAAAK